MIVYGWSHLVDPTVVLGTRHGPVDVSRVPVVPSGGTSSDGYIQCCTVGRVETLTYGQVLARFGHALSDATRARVLLALREAPGYPAELADLLGVSRQSLSNHLSCLRGCGLVVAVPQGRRTRYELADARLGHALGDLLGAVLAVEAGSCPADASGECR
jgi:DNA-binding transcriptional ArsR family regulator